MTVISSFLIVVSLTLAFVPLAHAQTVVREIPVGPAPLGVGIDTSSKLLYVADSQGNEVTVINTKQSSLVKNVPVGLDPLDVAVNPVTHKAYVSNFGNPGSPGSSGGGSVSVITKQGFKVKTTIPLGDTANSIGIDLNPITNTVYVSNWRFFPIGPSCCSFPAVTVINGTSDTIITTIGPLAGASAGGDDIVVDPATNTVYVSGNNPTIGSPSAFISIDVINGLTNTVSKTFTISGACLSNGGGVFDMADDPATNTVWIDGTSPCGSNSYLWALDGTTGSMKAAILVTPPPFGFAVLNGIGVDSAKNLVYLTDSGDNLVFVYDGSNGTLLATLSPPSPTGSPQDATVDPTTNMAYVSEDSSNQVTVIAGP